MTWNTSDLLQRWIHNVPLGRALDLGAGSGETARWLAEQGFQVVAVENDPVSFNQLLERCAGCDVSGQLIDLLDFTYKECTYKLILASAVLHFLKPTALWSLVDRIISALAPGGYLIADVFTTDDPGYEAFQASGTQPIEPNTYLVSHPKHYIHYFEPDELRRLFSTLEVLEYEEFRRIRVEDEGGYAAGASLVARKAKNG